jgi:hypothetical protein
MPYKNKEDRNANHKRRMAEDPKYREKRNARNKVWEKNNPEKVKEKNKRLYSEYTGEQMKERTASTKLWRILNPGKTEAFNERRKIRVLAHYGKDSMPVCCWEGCTVCDPDMLSIDHVFNNGAEDRATRGTGNNLYLSLEKEGFPEGFQTLCHNHQWKKEIFRRKSLRVRNAKLASLSLDSSKKLDGSGDNTINMGAGRLLY